MINTSFLNDYRVKSLARFNEKYAFVMIIIFSLLPVFAMFSPQSFGPLFTGIAQLELAALIILGIFQLISYASFSSIKHPLSERMKLCFVKLKDCLLNNKVGLILLVVYIISFAAALMAEDTQRSMYGTDFRPDGMRMNTCFMVVYIFSTLIKSKSLRKTIFMINIIGFVMVSLIVVQQYYGIIGSAGIKDGGAIGRYLMGVYDRWGVRIGHFYKGQTGSFYNLNHVAYYMTVCIMLISGMVITSKKTSHKIFWSVLSVYGFFALVANNTFGCYLAVMAALIIIPVFIIIKDKDRNFKKIINAVLPLILFVCVSLAFIIADPSGNPISENFNILGEDVEKVATSEKLEEEHAGSGRLEMWLATVDMIKERPLLGYGPDNLKAHYVERDAKLDRAHNEPLERAVATGIPSALIYYGAIAYAIFLFIRKKDSHAKQTDLLPFMALIAYLVSSLFGVFLFYTGGFFIMMLAFVASKDKVVYISENKSTKKS